MIFKPETFHGEKPVVTDEIQVDASLEQRVADALATSEGIGAEMLKVVASGHEIFITGDVGSREEMDRAVQVALSVPGVEKVTVHMHENGAP